MEISEELKKFLEDNKDLITSHKYKELYEKANCEIRLFTGNLTELLYAANINPLDYMDEIPDFFFYKSDIESFNIPKHIKKIGDDAFNNCKNLKNIFIPNSITSIGVSAFMDCIDLKSITFEDDSNIQYIKKWTFWNCATLENIILPDTIKIISIWAFDGCSSLQTITLPSTLERIDPSVFIHCDNLQTVYYNGRKESADQIKIYTDNNDSLLNATWYYKK